jgi:serine/threonine protein kinase
MQALQYLHSKCIAHRDLKLENLLFMSENQENLYVKLIDFGFASKFNPDEGMTLVLGSPLYMAPELVNRQAYSEKVDVWALGCITYLLLSGQTPFQSNTV